MGVKRLREVMEGRIEQIKRSESLRTSAQRILDDYTREVSDSFLMEMNSLNKLGWSVRFFSPDLNSRRYMEPGAVIRAICEGFTKDIMVEANRSRENGRILIEFDSIDAFISWYTGGCSLV